ncbi:SCO family protein [Tahibacter amnicola]|uniref:SCO family protein n=1 Tax=Tahibacter amnicola TaxID=2976241 RepID=A0ABY6BA79_9GAMM|nr:SCO family protein [Tahibacter amnicola]UXI66966.1 SCO family protein [Tahibacter amnicola]
MPQGPRHRPNPTLPIIRRMPIRKNAGRALPTAAILIAAFAGGLGLWLGARVFNPPAPVMTALTAYPAPRDIAEFSLTRASGQLLTRNDFKGHWSLVFFGFTHCPDICPGTLGTLKQVHAGLKAAQVGDRVSVYFISVDPQRDTPEVLGKYTGFFSPDFIAATGNDEELTRLIRSLGLLYARPDNGKGGYDVEHSGRIATLNPQGQLVGVFTPPFDVAAITADLQALAKTP